jgi:mannose-6-phosphate isomerase-like protein (cupin superfamily)
VNRVVTGYDGDGNPAIIRQGSPPVVIHAGRYTTTELWVSGRPPLTATGADLSAGEWALEPPPGGACFRIVEIAPGGEADDGEAGGAGAGGAGAGGGGAGGAGAGGGEAEPAGGDAGAAGHEGFQDAHATSTLDYVTVLRGEVTLVVGGAEVTLGPGDSVVQQPGVPHDWQNRTAQPCVMAGVLLSAL